MVVVTAHPLSVVAIAFISGHNASTGGSSIFFTFSAGAAAFTTQPDAAGGNSVGDRKVRDAGQDGKPGGALEDGGGGFTEANRLLLVDKADMLSRRCRGADRCCIFLVPLAGVEVR